MFSILITFMLWLVLIQTALLLVLFDVIGMDSLVGIQKLGAYLGWIGIAPMAIVIASWKLIERICSWAVGKYRRSHFRVEE